MAPDRACAPLCATHPFISLASRHRGLLVQAQPEVLDRRRWLTLIRWPETAHMCSSAPRRRSRWPRSASVNGRAPPMGGPVAQIGGYERFFQVEVVFVRTYERPCTTHPFTAPTSRHRVSFIQTQPGIPSLTPHPPRKRKRTRSPHRQTGPLQTPRPRPTRHVRCPYRYASATAVSRTSPQAGDRIQAARRAHHAASSPAAAITAVP